MLRTQERSVADGLDGSARLLGRAASVGPVEPEPFRIDVFAAGGRVRVAPVGELDLATAVALQDLLGELAADEPDVLVLDLSGLSFMDCAGLRILLETQMRARQTGLLLSVVCGPGQVRRLLAMSGVDQGLEIVEHSPRRQTTPRTAVAA